MQAVLIYLFPLGFGLAACLLGLALWEMRQRHLALIRAQSSGLPAFSGPQGLGAAYRDFKKSAALGLDRRLPSPLRQALKEKLEQAGLEGQGLEPGALVL